MKSIAAGGISGCLIWFLLVGIVSSCIVLVAFVLAAVTTESDLAVKVTSPLVCPKQTTGHINSYEGTSTDEEGFETPTTFYELQCLGSDGQVVYTDPIVWGFIWIGLLSGIGLVVSGVLAFLLAAPLGVLIGRFVGGTKARQM